MEYYKKNDMIFYKLDTNQNKYLEVFNNNNTQFRVMRIDDSNLYNKLVQRIQEFQFETCTEELFNQKLTNTLQQLQ